MADPVAQYRATLSAMANIEPSSARDHAAVAEPPLIPSWARDEDQQPVIQHHVQQAAPSSSAASLDRDVAERERKVALRESEMARKEAAIQAATRALDPKNWPICWPVLYHDIEHEVQQDNKALVRLAYIAWMLVSIGYVWNFVIVTGCTFSGSSASILDWIIAGLLMVIGEVVAWTCMYRSLYFAGARTTPSSWMWGKALYNLTWHCLTCVWVILALPTVGTFAAGLFKMLSLFSSASSGGGGYGSKGAAAGTLGIFCAVNVGLWGSCLVLSVIVYKGAMQRFAGNGGIRSAKEEGLAEARATFSARSGGAGSPPAGDRMPVGPTWSHPQLP